MVITTAIYNYTVKRILEDQGSLVDILYSTTTIGMNITKEDQKPHTRHVIGFFDKQVHMEGTIRL